MEERRFYSLQFVKELKEIETVEEVNDFLKKDWLLLQVTTKNDKGYLFLIGRVK